MNITQILGTKYPLIQGGMANIATGAFAAAVSNAGRVWASSGRAAWIWISCGRTSICAAA